MPTDTPPATPLDLLVLAREVIRLASCYASGCIHTACMRTAATAAPTLAHAVLERERRITEALALLTPICGWTPASHIEKVVLALGGTLPTGDEP